MAAETRSHSGAGPGCVSSARRYNKSNPDALGRHLRGRGLPTALRQNLGMPSDAIEPQADGRPERINASIEVVAKAIGDLDSLNRALLESLPASKPWQRQLRASLVEADRRSEVLRLVIAIDKSETEVTDACSELLAAMRAANAQLANGRADVSTKAAVLLALSLTLRIVDCLPWGGHKASGGSRGVSPQN